MSFEFFFKRVNHKEQRRVNLSKIKNRTYAVNLDECSSIGTQWIALYVNGDNVKYFDSFEDEHIPK